MLRSVIEVKRAVQGPHVVHIVGKGENLLLSRNRERAKGRVAPLEVCVCVCVCVCVLKLQTETGVKFLFVDSTLTTKDRIANLTSVEMSTARLIFHF